MIVHWASSVLGCRVYRGAQKGIEHSPAIVHVPLRMKAIRLSNHPEKFNVVKLKTAAQASFHLELRNRLESLERDGDASTGYEG